MSKGIKRISRVKRDIPANFAKPIGKIITRWAFLEFQLSRIMAKLLNLTDEESRLAMAEPRAQHKLEIIRSLLFLKGVTIDDKVFSTAAKGIDDIKKKRDLLAHGVWTNHDGVWKLISTTGSVTDQTIPKIARNRKIRPESFTVKTEFLVEISQRLSELSASLDTLENALPSQKTAQ